MTTTRARRLLFLTLCLVVAPIPTAATARGSDTTAEVTRVAVVLFPGVELLDAAGPAEVFARTRDEQGTPLFDVSWVGSARTPVESIGGLGLVPRKDVAENPTADVLVIPGGAVEAAMDDPRLMKWIADQARAARLVLSVCNGASILGRLQLLDGLDVATHHDNVALLKFIAPAAQCRMDAKFVDTGRIVTAAGISAGIDGALHAVWRLKGRDAARRVATYIEYDPFVGFRDDAEALLAPDPRGVVSLRGRVHPAKPWTIVRLVETIRSDGIEAALARYPSLLEEATGDDRLMMEEHGLAMSGSWLLRYGRDPAVAIDLMRFTVAAYPEFVQGYVNLARALLANGDRASAEAHCRRALAMAPEDSDAQKLLIECTAEQTGKPD
jgi:putative intracellular protease/amidase